MLKDYDVKVKPGTVAFLYGLPEDFSNLNGKKVYVHSVAEIMPDGNPYPEKNLFVVAVRGIRGLMHVHRNYLAHVDDMDEDAIDGLEKV